MGLRVYCTASVLGLEIQGVGYRLRPADDADPGHLHCQGVVIEPAGTGRPQGRYPENPIHLN